MNKNKYRRRIEDGESATVAVTRAVTRVSNTPSEELPTLYGSIPTNALDALVDRGDDVQIRFEYDGFDVEVTAEEVRLEKRH